MKKADSGTSAHKGGLLRGPGPGRAGTRRRQVPHVRASAHLAADEPSALGLGVRPRHHAHRDAHLLGQLPVRGQPGAWGQAPRLDVRRQRVRDGPIERALSPLEFRHPT
jgi:hypothetical protein